MCPPLLPLRQRRLSYRNRQQHREFQVQGRTARQPIKSRQTDQERSTSNGEPKRNEPLPLYPLPFPPAAGERESAPILSPSPAVWERGRGECNLAHPFQVLYQVALTCPGSLSPVLRRSARR